MIPVCALIKYKERDGIGMVEIHLDGAMVYWRRPESKAHARALAHLMNTLWVRVGYGSILHIDIDYDIEEPPLC